MSGPRLPWEVVETLPSSDRAELTRFDDATAETDPAATVGALVGASLMRYWADALGVESSSARLSQQRRDRDVARAIDVARTGSSPDVLATALLGRLYACWGPPRVSERAAILAELDTLRPRIHDQELRVRIVEWQVLERFDAGDLDGVRSRIEEFLIEARGLDSKLFRRREILWRANLEMLEGRIDLAVQLNEEAIASTADLAGSPFSFQNVAITMAIAMYLRRGLGELIGAIRSILASSPRVQANWEVGLTFALSEIGEFDEAQERFDRLAANDFATVPTDLNWLVSMQLLGLVAVNLDDRDRAADVRRLLEPFSGLDATHGSGYASYGPVDRTLGLLAERLGELDTAERAFDAVVEGRAAGPWTTLALADRARTRRRTDPAGALADAERAERELRGFGLATRADEVRQLVTTLRLDGHGRPIARRGDDTWTLRHPAGQAEVADGVGIRRLVELLRRPGQPVDVLDLDPEVDRAMPRSSIAESTLDPAARRAYRRRLDELERQSKRTEEHQREADFIRRELGAAAHVVAGAREIERARLRVTTSLRRTIDAISDDAPKLGGHLRATVETGRRCTYAPLDGTGWDVET